MRRTIIFVSKLLPLFPLDVVLFPRAPLPLHIFEPRYKEMIGECLQEQKPFGMVRASRKAIATVGCTASIVTVVNKYEDGRMDIITMGEQRFQIETLDQSRPFLQAQIRDFHDDSDQAASLEDAKRALDLHGQLVLLLGDAAENVPLTTAHPDLNSPQLSYLLAASLPLELEQKQTMLEMKSEQQRLLVLINYYEALVPKLRRVQFAKLKSKGNGQVM